MNSTPFRFYPKDGLLNVLLGGLINAADFGKIASDFYKILFRWFLWLLSALFLEDTKQALSFLSPDTETLHSNLRRYAHIILFAVFTFLFTLTLHNFHSPYYLLAFPLLYTWADEATKVFIPGRHFSWFDVGLNLIGVVIGVVLGFAVVG